MNDRVITTIEDGIAEVRLNRPDKHNALDLSMFEGLRAAGEALLERRDIRAVVLHGAGPSFCSGLDYPSFMAAGESAMQALFGGDDGEANNAQMSALIWRRLPVPVICAIHGNAFGGGLQIAAGADIRIAHPAAKLSIMEVKYGLIPDMALTVTLANQIDIDTAKELTMTGRILSGEQARQVGLATRTDDDPLAAARALAADIAAKSPDAVRAGKALFERSWGTDRAKTLQLEATLQKKMFSGPNQMEAVMAAMEKRTPNFNDPLD